MIDQVQPGSWKEKIRWLIQFFGLGILLLILVIAVHNKEIFKRDLKTNIEIRIRLAIPVENKLGGMQFAVNNRWNYHRVIFNTSGFGPWFKLYNIVCERIDGKKDHFNPKENPEEWLIWLERFQEVLIEATFGEKNIPNAPSPIKDLALFYLSTG